MKLKPELNNQFKTQIIDEIMNLKKNVEDFNYKDLRAVKTKNSSVKFRASDECVNKLFSMFANKFIYSNDNQIKRYFNTLEKQPSSEEAQMLQLAEALLTFKQKVELSEDEYFSNAEYGSHLGKLAANSNWVMRFQFLIEMHLQDMKVQRNGYLQSIRCIKTLSEKVYLWIETHKPNSDLLNKYTTLQSYDHEEFKEKFSKDKVKAKRRLSMLFETLDDTNQSLNKIAKKIETDAEKECGIKSTKN